MPDETLWRRRVRAQLLYDIGNMYVRHGDARGRVRGRLLRGMARAELEACRVS